MGNFDRRMKEIQEEKSAAKPNVSLEFNKMAEECNRFELLGPSAFTSMLKTQYEAYREYRNITGKVHGFISEWANSTGLSENTVRSYNSLANKIVASMGWRAVEGLSRDRIVEMLGINCDQDMDHEDSDDSEKSIYIISDGSGWVKIGESKSPDKRINGLQTGNPKKLSLEWQAKIPKGFSDKDIHGVLESGAEGRSDNSQEWFKISTEKAVAIISGFFAAVEIMNLRRLYEQV